MMIKNKKQNMFWMSVLVALLLGVFTGARIMYVAMNDSARAKVLVHMEIDYGEGDRQVFPVDIIASGVSVGTYLRFAEEKYGLPIEKRGEGKSLFVEAFHGVHNTNTSVWKYSLNNTEWYSDLSKYTLHDGDTLVWKRK